jgi:hypothetical protein
MKTFAFLVLAISTNAFAQLRGPAPQILVPAAGSVQAANGTFFHSDIAIYNYRNEAQTILLQWLPRGTSGLTGPLVQMRLSALSGVISEDFVVNFLHQQGVGAILVTALSSDGSVPTVDPAGRLVVTERIWTPQPGTTGTVSQTFPTLATSEINSQAPAILGQRIDDRYRTNVGIVNLSSSEVSFDVLQNSDDPTVAPIVQTVTVPPFAMQQVSAQNFKATALQIRVTAPSTISPAQWMAYGSSVDNVTGDSWSSIAMTVLPPP